MMKCTSVLDVKLQLSRGGRMMVSLFHEMFSLISRFPHTYFTRYARLAFATGFTVEVLAHLTCFFVKLKILLFFQTSL